MRWFWAGALSVVAGCGAQAVPVERHVDEPVPPPPTATARIVDFEDGVRAPQDWIEEWPALSTLVASLTAARLAESWEPDATDGFAHCFTIHLLVPGPAGDLVFGRPPREPEPPSAGTEEQLAAALARVTEAGGPAHARPLESGGLVRSSSWRIGDRRAREWGVCFLYDRADARPRMRRFARGLPSLAALGDTLVELGPVQSASRDRVYDAFEMMVRVQMNERDRPRLEAALLRAGFEPPESMECAEAPDVNEPPPSEDDSDTFFTPARSTPSFDYETQSPWVSGGGGWNCQGAATFLMAGGLSPES